MRIPRTGTTCAVLVKVVSRAALLRGSTSLSPAPFPAPTPHTNTASWLWGWAEQGRAALLHRQAHAAPFHPLEPHLVRQQRLRQTGWPRE